MARRLVHWSWRAVACSIGCVKVMVGFRSYSIFGRFSCAFQNTVLKSGGGREGPDDADVKGSGDSAMPPTSTRPSCGEKSMVLVSMAGASMVRIVYE